MALLSGNVGGNDGIQIGLAVFGITLTLIISMMLPILLPTSATGYTMEEIYENRAALESFTGQSMITQAPWKLSHVYTPYIIGESFNQTEEGWLYGEELTQTDPETGKNVPYYAATTEPGQNQIGRTAGIHLEPTRKSDVPLFQTQSAEIPVWTLKSYYSNGNGGINLWGQIVKWFTGNPLELFEQVNKTYPVWNFSGYRYEFDPMLRITTEEGNQRTADDAKLNIVWYDLDGQEGISGGLVLYNSKTNGIVANYTAAEIIAGYNMDSMNASRYSLIFNDNKVNMFIRFDPSAAGYTDLSQAWTDGNWTIAFSADSVDAFMDITNSTTFTQSVGSMINTYLQIMTMDVPQLDAGGNLILWVICVLPTGLAIIMFLSRFGLAGLGAGILGTAFAGGLIL